MQHAHVGMHAHDEHFVDFPMLHIAVNFVPLIGNNIPFLVNIDPRVLPRPDLRVDFLGVFTRI